MPPLKQKSKRKASELVKESAKPAVVQESESDYESDEENLLAEINDNEADSSDEEKPDLEGEESDDDVLSFESYDSDDEQGSDSLGFEDFAGSDSEQGSEEVSGEEELGSNDDEAESSEDDETSDLDEKISDIEEEDTLTKKPMNKKYQKHPKVELNKEEELEKSRNIISELRIVDSTKTVQPSTSSGITKSDDEAPQLVKIDEYADGDTSDEEDIRNTVGNIPMHWYDEYKHIGYDWDGKQIIKPPQGDQLDNFLKKMEDPNFWRTVKDPSTGQDVILSEEDIQLIKKIMKQRNADHQFNDYAPWIEWFTSEVEQLPIRNIPQSKASFLPSKVEKKKIGRLVHSLKMGWMKTKAEQAKIDAANKVPKFFMLWETDHGREKLRRIHDHVAAPKRALPGHAESYNPPAEYLFNESEMKEWERLNDQPHRRKLHFLPQKYKSLRQVPNYDRYIRERFLRCLDLYLCPRAKRMKVTVQPEDLIPKLPSPRDLQPFPTVQNMIYRGHTALIRTISVEPKGEYFCTGSDDMSVKIWEIATGRCVKTILTKDVVRSVAWCPNPKLSLIAVASGKRLLLINPGVGDIKLITKKTDDLLADAPKQDLLENERIKTAVQWSACTDEEETKMGIRLVLTHFQEIKQITWHGRGDYFASVMPTGQNRSVLIHQLSKRRSQIPFSKSKGLVQCVLFHPVKPCFFVATQQHIRIYDLVKQDLLRKLMPGCKWISSIAIHPKGDNLLVSTYDKKMLWFDLDLSTKPYQTLKLHASAVRSVAYHLRYPLFASGSDDRGVIVCHGMVYNDLLQNPLIVPLKRLDYHDKKNDFGIFDVLFHPTQPWLFSAGADNTVRLYT